VIGLEDRIRFANAKLRNIIYYRLTVEEACEKSRDPYLSRYRATYMHVLRLYRKILVELVNDIPQEDPRKNWFQGIIDLISPKVRTDECKDTIKRLRDYLNSYVQKQEK